jgi:hypothetical protein
MAWSQEVLIAKLNPIIRGWTNYHNSVVSSNAFQIFDHRIWELTFRTPALLCQYAVQNDHFTYIRSTK